MPCDYREYDKSWKFFSKQTIKDAGDKCELCYAPNSTDVWRPDKGIITQRPWYLYFEAPGNIDLYKRVKIILTVHHIDGDKENNSKQNLIALCQKCHLRLDLGKHLKNRKKTKSLPTLKLHGI